MSYKIVALDILAVVCIGLLIADYSQEKMKIPNAVRIILGIIISMICIGMIGSMFPGAYPLFFKLIPRIGWEIYGIFLLILGIILLIVDLVPLKKQSTDIKMKYNIYIAYAFIMFSGLAMAVWSSTKPIKPNQIIQDGDNIVIMPRAYINNVFIYPFSLVFIFMTVAYLIACPQFDPSNFEEIFVFLSITMMTVIIFIQVWENIVLRSIDLDIMDDVLPFYLYSTKGTTQRLVQRMNTATKQHIADVNKSLLRQYQRTGIR